MNEALVKPTDLSQARRAAFLRKIVVLRYYWVRRAASIMLFKRIIRDRVIIWPPFDVTNDEDSLQKLLCNARHFLGNLPFPIEYSICDSGIIKICLSHPPYDKPTKIINTLAQDQRETLRRARYVLCWQRDSAPRATSLWPFIYNVSYKGGIDVSNEWLRLVKDLYDLRHSLPKRFPSQCTKKLDSCAVLGTGPSVNHFAKESHLYDAWIGANYIACDKEICSVGKPFAICAMDTDFFAKTNSAETMWKNTFLLLRNSECILMTFLQFAPFIELNFPCDIKEKTFYLKTLGPDTSKLNTVFDLRQMNVTAFGNVLSDIMLPVATALSKSIVIYGCDGSPPDRGVNFPKSDRYQIYDDEQIKEFQKNNKPVWDASKYRQYFANNNLYTRFIVDECQKSGVIMKLRKPSWNSGLSCLPLYSETE